MAKLTIHNVQKDMVLKIIAYEPSEEPLGLTLAESDYTENQQPAGLLYNPPINSTIQLRSIPYGRGRKRIDWSIVHEDRTVDTHIYTSDWRELRAHKMYLEN